MIAAALIFLSVGPQSSAAAASGLDVLQRGPTCSGWQRISGLRSWGTYVSGGLRFHFNDVIDARNGRFAQRYAGGPNSPSGGQGFDGGDAWSEDDSGASHVLNSPHERALEISQAWIRRRGWCAPEFGGAGVTRTVTERDGGQSFIAVQVRPHNGLPIEMRIDRRTHVLDGTVVQLAETREIDHFSDWRTVAGVLVPFAQRAEYPEDEQADIWTTRGVTPTHTLAASTFASPPPPNDVMMLGGASSTTVPYRVEAQKPLIDVWLNGKGPFVFVPDTGGHFILTPQTARSIGVSGIGAANNLGAGTDIRKTSFARIAKVQIGAAVIRNQITEIIAYPFRRLERGAQPPKAGWLGLQFFERFRTTLNPRTHHLTLSLVERPKRPKHGIRIPLLFEEDAPVVACRIEAHPGMCMIDTGNAGPTIVEGHWLERAGLTERLRHGLERDGDRIDRARIDFGPVSLRHELVDFAPPAVRGSESTQAVAAIFSQDVIDRYITTFDYRAGWMSLEPLGLAPAPYNRTGLGVEKRADGSFLVSWVAANSPAAQAGFRANDRITGVDGIDASALSGADLFNLNHGPVGALRQFAVLRGTARLKIVVRLRDLI